MPRLSFYLQKRADGGLRTGIEIDGELVLHHFDEGRGEPDPILRWFVDVRCEGSRLPNEPETARQWFLENAAFIQEKLKALADELTAGMEPDLIPLTRKTPKGPGGAVITIVCSAARRVEALEIATVLRDLAHRWKGLLQNLEEYQPATR